MQHTYMSSPSLQASIIKKSKYTCNIHTYIQYIYIYMCSPTLRAFFVKKILTFLLFQRLSNAVFDSKKLTSTQKAHKNMPSTI